MFKFPTLDRMLAVEESELREMGFGYRAPFVTRSAAEITKNGGVVRCAFGGFGGSPPPLLDSSQLRRTALNLL